jgi:hypothetical protein
MKRRTFILFFLLCGIHVFAQKGVTTVGIQFKPIFPIGFLGSGKLTDTYENVTLENGLKSGFSGGLIIRKGFTDLIGIETGINYVKRRYQLTVTEGSFKGVSEYRVISYEIPLLFMVYAQLFEKTYMNGALGPSITMYPSSVATYDPAYFYHVAIRNHVVMPAITANLGWEYRTEKSGFIYIGASFQRPFDYIFTSFFNYKGNGKDFTLGRRLSGSYLTLDLRYFFHEDPVKKQRRLN